MHVITTLISQISQTRMQFQNIQRKLIDPFNCALLIDRIPVEALELTVEERRYLPYAWRLLGGDEMGSVPVQQMGRILRGFGKNPAERDLQYLKFNNGIEDDRRLLYGEFVDLFKQCQSEVDSTEKLIAAFRVFDKEGSGTILVTDLRDIMTRLGEPITDNEIDHMVRVADKTRSGLVNYEDFCRRVMTDNRPLLRIN